MIVSPDYQSLRLDGKKQLCTHQNRAISRSWARAQPRGIQTKFMEFQLKISRFHFWQNSNCLQFESP